MRLIAFILILFPFISSAQIVEEVEYSLDSIKSIQDKIAYLNDWTGKNYRKNPKEAEYYALQTIKLGQDSKNYSGIGNAYIRIGSIYRRKGKYDLALLNYNNSINNFSLASDSAGMNLSYLNRGLILRKTAKYDLALKDYYSVLRYYEKNYNASILCNTNNNIGIVYKDLKNYTEALMHYKKAAEFSVKLNNTSYLFSANNNIAVVYTLQKNFKEALNFYNKNLIILEKKPNKYKLAQTYHNIGNCFFALKQYYLALEYYNKSLKLKESIGNKDFITTTLNSLGITYYMTNNLNKALIYSKEAYNLTLITNNLTYRKTSCKDLFKIYSHLKEPDSTIFYFDRYEALKDSLINREKLSQISILKTKYETEKKEAQIAILEKENKNKVMQRNGLMIILVLIAAYAAFIVSSYYRNKKTTRLLSLQKTRIEWSKEILDQKNKDLLVSNQTKNKLFQIISHDLRSPLASVSGIAKLIQIFIQQGRYGELNDSSKDLGESVTRVLNLTDNLLSWSLNQSGRLPYTPVVLSVNKLLSGIFETYQSVAQEKSIHMELTACDSLFIYGDRSMLETVVRNLINNAIKFTPDGGIIMAGAKLKDGITEIWIKDSGKGIPEEQLLDLFKLDDGKSNLGTRGERGNGLGLILCKDFIAQNDGEIWVESKENIGSTFRFTVPNAEKVYQEDLISKQ